MRKNLRKTQSRIGDDAKDNQLLFVIVFLGMALLATGMIPPYHQMLIAIGAAFIIAGSVGIYMMLATRQVAKKLHERFNEQNDILSSHTEILKDMASSQKDMASSQKDMASSQKDMASSLKRLENNFSDMGKILKRIEDKL